MNSSTKTDPTSSSTQAPRHVAITGAGTGIGRAIALRLGRGGAHLTLMARGRERLEQTAREARAGGAPEVCVVSGDVRDRRSVTEGFELAAGQLGPFTDLVANSGIGGPNTDAEGPEGDRFDELIATNLSGSYYCARAVAPHLAPGPGPRSIVFVSSILGRIGVPGYTGYCASKAGLLGLTRALAMEHAPSGVQVNAICPGWVDTEMARAGIADIASGAGISEAEALELAMREVPLGRMGRPEEVAGLVAYLLSEDARGIVGQALDMNGGAMMS